MTMFKQIIGRGTRIREKDGKTHFVVMDFRNVTRLFADPDWDGPIEQDEGFHHIGTEQNEKPDKQENNPEEPYPNGEEGNGENSLHEDAPYHTNEIPIVDKDGCRVKIVNKMVSVYDVDGKLLRQEDIIDYTKTNVQGQYASLSDFIRKWNSADKKKGDRKILYRAWN